MSVVIATSKKLTGQLFQVLKRPLIAGSIVALVAVGLAIGFYLSQDQPHKLTVWAVKQSTPVKTTARVPTASPAAQPSSPAPSAAADTTTSKPKTSATSTAPKPPASSTATHGSDVLRYPLPGIPTAPTIKMDYTSTPGGAHFLYIYTYNMMVNNFEFIVHPVRSENYTSDFTVPGYLDVVFSSPTAEPSQQVNGNPNLDTQKLSVGDIYTISVCDYDSGSCGVISSNTVTLTVVSDYSHGIPEITYQYSN